MKMPLVLAVFLTPLASAGSMIGLVTSDDLTHADIVMERASYCDYVVVRAYKLFVLLHIEDEFTALAGARQVSGLVREMGVQRLTLDGRAPIQVRVEGWDNDRDQAEDWFKQQCNIDEGGLQRFEISP
jgi:hypothetical protein